MLHSEIDMFYISISNNNNENKPVKANNTSKTNATRRLRIVVTHDIPHIDLLSLLSVESKYHFNVNFPQLESQ